MQRNKAADYRRVSSLIGEEGAPFADAPKAKTTDKSNPWTGRATLCLVILTLVLVIAFLPIAAVKVHQFDKKIEQLSSTDSVNGMMATFAHSPELRKTMFSMFDQIVHSNATAEAVRTLFMPSEKQILEHILHVAEKKETKKIIAEIIFNLISYHQEID